MSSGKTANTLVEKQQRKAQIDQQIAQFEAEVSGLKLETESMGAKINTITSQMKEQAHTIKILEFNKQQTYLKIINFQNQIKKLTDMKNKV